VDGGVAKGPRLVVGFADVAAAIAGGVSVDV
jgi:hypothetical protein